MPCCSDDRSYSELISDHNMIGLTISWLCMRRVIECIWWVLMHIYCSVIQLLRTKCLMTLTQFKQYVLIIFTLHVCHFPHNVSRLISHGIAYLFSNIYILYNLSSVQRWERGGWPIHHTSSPTLLRNNFSMINVPCPSIYVGKLLGFLIYTKWDTATITKGVKWSYKSASDLCPVMVIWFRV